MVPAPLTRLATLATLSPARRGEEKEGHMKTAYRLDRQRRVFLQRSAAVMVGPLLITERTIAQTRTLYINSWGGSYTAAQDVAYFKPFTAATGIQVRTVTPVSFARMKSQVQSGSYQVG